MGEEAKGRVKVRVRGERLYTVILSEAKDPG